tara:strand:- start:15738 stop:16496 length:759 start_codon:yes stop_codon:yes gene_type:complete
MSKKIIAGNWKQNGNLSHSIKLTRDILADVEKNQYKHEIIIFPPSLYLLETQHINKKSVIKIGSQNVSAYHDGAYTGEIGASMLKDSKVKYCLVGHSERRHIINESDEICSSKVLRLYENNIKIIYCIGETLEEYKDKKTKIILKKQIRYLLKKVSKEINNKPSNLIFAYEPVWAIGTGLVPTSRELLTTFNFIRKTVDSSNEKNKLIKLLYGGSVSPDNASALMKTKYIDGLLIGGSSLVAKKFIAICSTI